MKYSIEKINQELKDGWECISDTYTNLDSELTFRCNEGHEFVSTWRKIRDTQICPICSQNLFKQETKIKKPFKKKKGEYRVLALDQATYTTGYAIFDDEKLVYYNSYTVEGDQIERIIKIRDWFISLIDAWDPDRVAFEGIVLNTANGTNNVTTFETLAFLLGVLVVTAVEKERKYLICTNSTWRNYCQIKGRTRSDRKRSTQLKVKEWYNIDASEDCADAICIGRYASHEVTPPKIITF